MASHAHAHDHHGNPRDLTRYLKRLEEKSRDAWQKPPLVLRALQLSRNVTVGEVGPGPGYFTKRIAARARFVYAAEVSPEMLAILRERLARVPNVAPILCDPGDPRFPPASCDRILVVNTLHHVHDRVSWLRRVKRALKPRGFLLNIDFTPGSPHGPPPEMRLSREKFVAEARAAGFRTRDAVKLPFQYAIALR